MNRNSPECGRPELNVKIGVQQVLRATAATGYFLENDARLKMEGKCEKLVRIRRILGDTISMEAESDAWARSARNMRHQGLRSSNAHEHARA